MTLQVVFAIGFVSTAWLLADELLSGFSLVHRLVFPEIFGILETATAVDALALVALGTWIVGLRMFSAILSA